jgi:hypothetical protein
MAKSTVAALLKAFPSAMKIGAHRYELLKRKVPEHELAWAQTNNNEYKITIDPDAKTDTRLAHSVLHELLHGIWHDRFLWTNKALVEHEEEAIQQICAGLVAAMLDNPWLLPWLTKALR